MKDCDGVALKATLKESKAFGVNTSNLIPKSSLMKKINEEFLPGDLVFAEFSGYSWPALVTKVRAKTIQIVTLVLEQDELIDKENAVIYGGNDHLKEIMSVLTPGERQDFSEASTSLMELNNKSRLERLDHMNMERFSVSDGSASSKENNDKEKNESTENETMENGTSNNKIKRKPYQQIPKCTKISNQVYTDLPSDCEIHHSTIPIGTQNLNKTDNDFKPKLTLQIGTPNFCSLDASVSSESEQEIKVRLGQHSVFNTLLDNKHEQLEKLQTKQEKDENFITNAVELTNKILESGGTSLELIPGHQLSYERLKLVRERAMIMVGAVDHNNRRGRSKSKSVNLLTVGTKEIAAKAHSDHLKAVRASQKKSLKSHGAPLEIVQTTVKNPSKKPGRKSTVHPVNDESAVISQLAAEEAFHEAAEKIVAEAKNDVTSIEEVANTAAELLVGKGRRKSVRVKNPIAINNTDDNDANTSDQITEVKDKTNSVTINSESVPLFDESIITQHNEFKSPEKSTKNQKSPTFRKTTSRSTRLSKIVKEVVSNSKNNSKENDDTMKKNAALKEGEEKQKQEEKEVPEKCDAKHTSPVNISIVTKKASKKLALSQKNNFEAVESSVIVGNINLEEFNIPSNEFEISSIKSDAINTDSKIEMNYIKSLKESLPSTKDPQEVDIINFLSPYYLNLFRDAIKEQLHNQIKLDLEQLPQKEKDLIYKLAEGSSPRIKKPAYDIISKLIKNSTYLTLLPNNLPEVGPGTPPASPKAHATPANKIMPHHSSKRKLPSKSQEVLHNPFPISLLMIDDTNKKQYLESETINKKHSVIPRSWSQYMRGQGKFASSSSTKSKSHKKDGTSVTKKTLVRENKALGKCKKVQSPQSSVNTTSDINSSRKHALLLYVQDIQAGMSDPTILKQTEVKFDTLETEIREMYLTLGGKFSAFSSDDITLENHALALYVKSTAGSSRLDWLTLAASKKKKFLMDAKKVNNGDTTAQKIADFNKNLISKMLNSESRKRKRESHPLDDESEPSTKKEKGDGTILDFFCLDCFTLDYNPKKYSPCSGCHALFHTTCLQNQTNATCNTKQRNLCKECRAGPVCLLCRKGTDLKTCAHCPHQYHDACVRTHMSSQVLSATSFICPYHVCGSCEARPEINIKNFVRCVRCPQSFHDNHIPAGCMRISRSHILCFRHFNGFGKSDPSPSAPKAKRKKKILGAQCKQKKIKGSPLHINVPFCFQCTYGGDLICCEGCPASFHSDCVPEENQLKEGEVSWLCPDCIVGKKAFIGDIVWVKFGQYRWWPCQVQDELDLPENIFAKLHKPCQFPAICLGTNEYSWIDMSRVYSYEDGDKGSASTSNVSKSFKLALVEAKDLHSKLKPSKESLLQETTSLDKPASKKPAPYRFIKVNSPYNAAMREYEKQLRMEREPFPCDCTAADKCSADSSCINRVLLTECPPGCRWENECENRRFQRRQYPATKLVKTEGRGWGLVACQDITTGSLVHEYVGEIIDEVEVERRLHHYQSSGITDYYMLTVENSRIIDAKPKANHARFMNHSCDPNCETQKWNVCGLTCIGLFSKRHVKVGEELTFDYQFDTRGQQKKPCLCGSANCSGFLGAPAKKIVEVKEVSQSAKKKGKRRKRNVDKKCASYPEKEEAVMSKEKEHSSPKSVESNQRSCKSMGKKIAVPTKQKKTTTKLTVKKSTKHITKRKLSSQNADPKNSALSKKITKVHEIEEDLQKINEIVNNVTQGEIQ